MRWGWGGCGCGPLLVSSRSRLLRYINAGGKPTEAIGFISENYRGYAQMANLVGGWMQLVGDAPASADGGAASHSAAGSSGAGACV